MQQYINLILVMVLFVGCTDRDDDLNGVNIRIKNESQLTYDVVQVGNSGVSYENIGPDTYSGYMAYETAYSYTYIKIKAAEENYILQPVDFVGEIPLENGFYTYALDISGKGDVILNFMVD